MNLVNFYKRSWKTAILVGLAYLALMWVSEHFIPHPATLFPAASVALSALFFSGLELWPVIFFATLVGVYLGGFPAIFLLLTPISYTLQAVVGAYAMRRAKIDPLFRRSRDMFFVISTILLVSLITPTFGTLEVLVSNAFFHSTVQAATWGLRYTGNVLCLLILTPFLLRWFAKPRFSRTYPEVVETLLIFAILIAIDVPLFMGGAGTVLGVPLVYLLLIPLFWLALRLRPRFLTLALVITTTFSILGLYVGATVPPAADFSLRLFQIEEFMVVLSMIFFIIVSLEEDRRLNANLLRSQVATLENAVSRISSESSAKNDFIAVLGHELRNPLAPVVSGIDLLKMKEGLDSEELETLEMMEKKMATVQRLLDDLLDISRITEGKIALKKEPIDLEAVIKQAIISTTHYLKERHQSLTFKAPDKPLFIQGDPVRIEQVFSNLLTNASKYSDAGGSIRITIKKRDGHAEIVISDTGIGIEASVLEMIFTPFQQAGNEAQSKKGLGIGLALVRSFVEMHDGVVTAASKGLGFGSEFTVTFPTIQIGAGSRPRAKTTNKSAPAQSNGLSVLVVDDNDAAAWGMGKLLELKGCTVSYAYDGNQAIEEVANSNPDVVLMDIGLPDQDGYNVAKTMRARGYRGKLIALTGYSTDDARIKGRSAGFEQYLIKPAGINDLKRVIPEIA